MSAVTNSILDQRRSEHRSQARAWIVGECSTVTNELLADAFRRRGLEASLVRPRGLNAAARCGEVVLGRVDVRETLDGIQDGIWELRRAERRGLRVLNPAPSLVACHDKLHTAIKLARFGVPQPDTAQVDVGADRPGIAFPVVLKPRFGSWGRDVVRCDSQPAFRDWIRRFRRRPWFRRHGALVQTLVHGFDLRIVVADGRVVGAVERVPAPGEWRTNVALGALRRPVREVPAEAAALALSAACAVEGDLVGVDLLPLACGGYVVLEVNGAVDLTQDYSLDGVNVFDAAAHALLSNIADADVSAGVSG